MIVKQSSNKLSIERFGTFDLMSLIHLYNTKGLTVKAKGRLLPCIKYGRNYVLIIESELHFIFPYEPEGKYESYLKDKLGKYFDSKFIERKEIRLDQLKISYDPTLCTSIKFKLGDWKFNKPPNVEMLQSKSIQQLELIPTT